MNRYLRVAVGLGALIAGLVLAGETRASITIVSDNEATGTLQDWSDLGSTGFQQQDARWTWLGSTILAPTTSLRFLFVTSGNTDFHTLSIGDIDPAHTGATLHYTIQVTTPNNGGLNNFAIVAATLDTTTFGVGSLVVKNFAATTDGATFLTLASTSGGSETVVIPGLKFLDVQESWTVVPGDFVMQTLNAFTQGPVHAPEPASVAIWSLLAAGSWLGVRIWRRGKPVPRQPWDPEARQAIRARLAQHLGR